MTAPRFTAQGKQVLCDGQHFADACDETAALAIVTALNAGWQPIETAPRDGSDVLLYCADTGEQFVAFWAAAIEDGKTDWVFARAPNVSFIVRYPTHWMPLHDAPTPSPSVTREGGE